MPSVRITRHSGLSLSLSLSPGSVRGQGTTVGRFLLLSRFFFSRLFFSLQSTVFFLRFIDFHWIPEDWLVFSLVWMKSYGIWFKQFHFDFFIEQSTLIPETVRPSVSLRINVKRLNWILPRSCSMIQSKWFVSSRGSVHFNAILWRFSGHLLDLTRLFDKTNNDVDELVEVEFSTCSGPSRFDSNSGSSRDQVAEFDWVWHRVSRFFFKSPPHHIGWNIPSISLMVFIKDPNGCGVLKLGRSVWLGRTRWRRVLDVCLEILWSRNLHRPVFFDVLRSSMSSQFHKRPISTGPIHLINQRTDGGSCSLDCSPSMCSSLPVLVFTSSFSHNGSIRFASDPLVDSRWSSQRILIRTVAVVRFCCSLRPAFLAVCVFVWLLGLSVCLCVCLRLCVCIGREMSRAYYQVCLSNGWAWQPPAASQRQTLSLFLVRGFPQEPSYECQPSPGPLTPPPTPALPTDDLPIKPIRSLNRRLVNRQTAARPTGASAR